MTRGRRNHYEIPCERITVPIRREFVDQPLTETMTMRRLYEMVRGCPLPAADFCLLAGVPHGQINTLLLRFEQAGLLLWEATMEVYGRTGRIHCVFIGALEEGE